MPYVLRKALGKDKYWVVNAETKKKYSKDPLPKRRAEAQRRALYASERRGGADDDYDVQTPPIPLQASPYDPQIKRILLRMRDSVSPRATTTFQAFPGLFDDDVMENDALLDRVMELFEWADYPNGRFYVVDVLDEMVRGINTARGREGGAEPIGDIAKKIPKVPQNANDSIKSAHQDFLKSLELQVSSLLQTQESQIKQANSEFEKTQEAQNQKKEGIEEKDIASIRKEEEKLLKKQANAEKIGAGIPESQLVELLNLFSKTSKRKPKQFKKHLNRWIKKQLKGGKLKPCPPGMKDNKLGMCVDECNPDEQDFGTWCTKKCAEGETDTGIECIENKCPEGYSNTLLTCYKPPGGGQCEGGKVIPKEITWSNIYCEGDPLKFPWQKGHWQCRGGPGLSSCPSGYVDDGLLCRKPITCSKIIPPASILKPRKLRRTRPKRMESSIDWKGSLEDLKVGLDIGFKELGEELARKFDPEKNGVAEAFRKFGAYTKEAFEEIGKRIIDLFTKQIGPAIVGAMERFGQKMIDTVGNGDWWRQTMSDPKTYVFIIGTIATVAATVLSAGLLAAPAAGMTVSMAASITALSALGPCLNMITDAAEGEPIDVLDIVSLGLALVPIAGQASVGRQLFAQQGMKALLASRIVGTGMTSTQLLVSAAQIGSIIVTGCQIAQDFGLIKKMPIMNAPTGSRGPPSPGDKPDRTACEDLLMGYACEYPRTFNWTASCPKPNCDPMDYSYGAKKCKEEKKQPATNDKNELYKRATLVWFENKNKYMRQMPESILDASAEKQEEYEHAFKLDPSKFPAGFNGWTDEFPEPTCWLPNLVSEKTRTCMTQEEYLAEPESIYDLEFGVANEDVKRELEEGDTLDVDVRFLADMRPDLAKRFSSELIIPFGASIKNDDGTITYEDAVVSILNVEALRDFAWKSAGDQGIPLIGMKALYEQENGRIADMEQELEWTKEDGPEGLTQEQFQQKIFGLENYILASKDVLRPIEEQRTQKRLNKLRFEDAVGANVAQDPTKGINTPEEQARRLKVFEAQELWDDALFRAPSMAGDRMPFTPNWYAMNKTLSNPGGWAASPFVYLLADPKLGTPLENLIRKELVTIEPYSNNDDVKGIGRAVFERIKFGREKLAEARAVANESGKPWSPNNISARTKPLTDSEAATELFNEEQARYSAQQAEETKQSIAEQQAKQQAESDKFTFVESGEATRAEIARQLAAARGGSRRCIF